MNTPVVSFVHLIGKKSSALLEVSQTAAPIWRHWGVRLDEDAVPQSPLSRERPVPSFSLDENVLPSLFPTFGVGWYGAPALLAHRSSKDSAQQITACSVEWLTPNQKVRFTLLDEVSELEVQITLALDLDSDVLTSTTTLCNLGQRDLVVQYLASACLPLPPTATHVRAFTGRHNHEFQLFEDQLSPATWLRENRRGLTSHDCVPASIVRGAATNLHAGPAFGAQLAWSGNHGQRIDRLGDGGYFWQMGLWLAPGEVTLKPQEALNAPEVLATFSLEGLNGVAQNFHQAIRARMTWPHGAMKPRPVHFNTWEGVYFNLEESALKEMATHAADIGVERFVLDDGWFKGRRSDTSGLGDWWVDESVFPSGLGPLIEHVTGLGMEFGLWVEPEMVNPDSDLFRAHPDWALQLHGRPLLTARNQLVLDLSNPEVISYLQGRLEALLDAYPISYLKWDHNRDLTTAGHNEQAAYRTQTLAAYRLFDTLRARWPHVEIEACAGGGGRIDAGILQRTHRVWTSDCIDAVSRVAIQRGFLQFFPPEIMGSHIGTSPAHSTGRRQSIDFRASVALGGHFGIELDPRHLTPHHHGKVKEWVGSYKALRDRLHSGHVWQGEAGDHVLWQAHGEVHDFVLMIYRLAPSSQNWPPAVPIPFADPSATYTMTLVTPHGDFSSTDGAFFGDLNEGITRMSGAWLGASGIPLPSMKAETSLIVRLTARETR
jgi:alpha-galactosidase